MINVTTWINLKVIMLCERSQGQKKTYLGFHSSETLQIIETTNLCYSDKKLFSGCLELFLNHSYWLVLIDSTSTLLGVKKVFFILILMFFTWIYIFVKALCTSHLFFIYLFIWQHRVLAMGPGIFSFGVRAPEHESSVGLVGCFLWHEGI